ncbi:hypothetical protein CURE108131_11065 [Cupriavidus respiraculi]|uniref:Transcriptional regulator n=1 Tax=Cupriavidus respiraculi TaxID=195930 RepID=A0ABM8WXJ5_9BURK|nr:hypothetical protein [Cupriavidus respiraculi]MBY4945394.1 hypothetical protein [Cupriavidus respiraculi]CAG9172249.1 hypothetical protein LMG21510_01910 [Cupriavidus respiraculi]
MKRDADLEYQILVTLERAGGYHLYCPHLMLHALDGTLVSYEAKRGHLYLLADRGLVSETKSNHWRLTAAGHEELARLRGFLDTKSPADCTEL